MDWRLWSQHVFKAARSCALAALALSVAMSAHAQNAVLAGQVRSAATDQPIVGAALTASFRDETWQIASDLDGFFSLSLDLPGEQRLHIVRLMVEHEDFAAASSEIEFVDRVPEETPPRLRLFPKDLVDCRLSEANLVIVGHFRSPIEQTIDDLPDRLAEALQFDLLTHMQQNDLPLRLQPVFASCGGARPRLPAHAKMLAQALRAHAFVHGSVQLDSDDFTVSALVSDAYALSSQPIVTQNEAVDLANPSSAQLNPETYAAVLLAVAAGVAEQSDCPGALRVLSAAESMAGPSALRSAIEQLCEVGQ